MYTLLDSCLDRLDIFEFLNHVEDGLKDHYDIKMLTYLMLVRLSHLCPSAVLQSKYIGYRFTSLIEHTICILINKMTIDRGKLHYQVRIERPGFGYFGKGGGGGRGEVTIQF